MAVEAKEKLEPINEPVKEPIKEPVKPKVKKKPVKKPEKRSAVKKVFYRGIGDKLEIWAFDRKNQWKLLHSIDITPALGDKFRLPLIIETRYIKKGKPKEKK